VRYLRANDQSGVVPEWYIAHRTGGGNPPPDTLDRRGVRYELRRRYPTAPLSGFTWYLFQRAR
jgi:hypothetical protein